MESRLAEIAERYAELLECLAGDGEGRHRDQVQLLRTITARTSATPTQMTSAHDEAHVGITASRTSQLGVNTRVIDVAPCSGGATEVGR